MLSSYQFSDILGDSCSREDALLKLKSDDASYRIFLDFPQEEQEKIVSFIQGAQGLKIIYDNFFKKIMDPDAHPKRLEVLSSWISLFLLRT